MKGVRSLWSFGRFGKFLVLLVMSVMGALLVCGLVALFFGIDSSSRVRATKTVQITCKKYEPSRVTYSYWLNRWGGGGQRPEFSAESWRFCLGENHSVAINKATYESKNVGDTVTVEYSKGVITGMDYYWSAK